MSHELDPVFLDGTIKLLGDGSGSTDEEFAIIPASAVDQDDWYWLIIPSDKEDFARSLVGLKVRIDAKWTGMLAGRAKFDVSAIHKS
jgi:hypothetical protein